MGRCARDNGMAGRSGLVDGPAAQVTRCLQVHEGQHLLDARIRHPTVVEMAPVG